MAQSVAARKSPSASAASGSTIASQGIVNQVRLVFRRWRRLYDLVKPFLNDATAPRADLGAGIVVVFRSPDSLTLENAVRDFLRETENAASIAKHGLSALAALYKQPRHDATFTGASAAAAAWNKASELAQHIQTKLAEWGREQAAEQTSRKIESAMRSISSARARGEEVLDGDGILKEHEVSRLAAETHRWDGNAYYAAFMTDNEETIAKAVNRHARRHPRRVTRGSLLTKLLGSHFLEIERNAVKSLESDLAWETAQLASHRVSDSVIESEAATQLVETLSRLREKLVPTKESRPELHGVAFEHTLKRWTEDPRSLSFQLRRTLTGRNKHLEQMFGSAIDSLSTSSVADDLGAKPESVTPSPPYSWVVLRAYELAHASHEVADALLLIEQVVATARAIVPDRCSIPGLSDVLEVVRSLNAIRDRLEREYEPHVSDAPSSDFKLVVEALALFAPNNPRNILAQVDTSIAEVRRSLERARSEGRSRGAIAGPLYSSGESAAATKRPTRAAAQGAVARALGLLVEHPEFSTARIAREIGCSREYLARDAQFRGARQAQKDARAERVRGKRPDRHSREGGLRRAFEKDAGNDD